MIRQRPPAYSAVKVGGRRAYALARAGETVELAEREVEVTRFEQLWREDDRAAFAIECSSGTYVRSLIADLGDAYCLELRRTGIGPFEVADADPTGDPPQRRARVPARGDLDGDDAPQGRPRRGRARRRRRAPSGSSTPTASIALAEPREHGLLKPVVGFRG